MKKLDKPVYRYSSVDVLGDGIAGAIKCLRATSGFDALRSPHFWETYVAIMLGGEQTPHKHETDVTVDIWGSRRRAEVKFSRAFWSTYATHGSDWSRNIFKWFSTKPQAAKRPADAMILVGVDVDDSIHSWVLPCTALPPGKRSITVTAPSSRKSDLRGRIDHWKVPPTEILPAFARASGDLFK